jgi:hypothetical protein
MCDNSKRNLVEHVIVTVVRCYDDDRTTTLYCAYTCAVLLLKYTNTSDENAP